MEDESTLSNKNGSKAVGGMESVIATVSGYHGSERFKLIKLINYTGASYVGAMTKSTTHLVCWEFKGRKYELAKSFGTKIVSHKWFEDCVEAGKRLPERHYMMKSGQQAGPILWEVPVAVDEKDDILTRKRGNVLCDMSNTSNGTQAVERNPESVWLDSHLLSEVIITGNLSPMGTNVTYHNRGKSAACRTSKRGCRLSSKKCSIEQSLSGLREIQHGEPSTYSSTFSTRHERNAYSSIENPITAGPTRKSRRLVKKNACRGILESSIMDLDQEFSPLNDIVDVSNDQNTPRTENENISIPQGRIVEAKFCGIENRNEEAEGREGITQMNNVHADDDLIVRNEGVAPVDDVPLQHGLSDSEDNYDRTQEVDSELQKTTRVPASVALSCVICWAEYSPTRGVLPCGHRFCYTCIQNWADHMASRRMASTCPLCKAIFSSITKVDSATSSDQKIYSQTIPYDSSATDIYVLPDWELTNFRAQVNTKMPLLSAPSLPFLYMLHASCYNLIAFSVLTGSQGIFWIPLKCKSYSIICHLILALILYYCDTFFAHDVFNAHPLSFVLGL
ncbi:hypothetical protein IFM89_027123 [Coptis chinensis]|uniref:RING-type E3 ubiquitin transferase BRCA1 n=1 Tax=Coptis chinensis TaxID=261450 RepID=A0A835IYJ5_9MAGN|nr:hypothetical protein IFM89_027123 [Coptis chinensis]